VPSRLKDKVLCVLCVLMFMYYYTVCNFTCVFYAVVRQISILFIDNKDSVFCMQISVMLVGECVHNLGDGCCVKSLMWGYVQL